MEAKSDMNNVVVKKIKLPEIPKKIKKTSSIPLICEEDIIEEDATHIIINKGTGAGGANTNINGLSYEDKTNLEELFSEINIDKKMGTKTIKFINYDYEFINANKSKLYKYLEQNGEKNNTLQQAAGCKEPDEAYIDVSRKIIFIIEKKFQQTPGSVDEKIQTGPFKKIHYSKQFPNYTINYVYCLSDWFKRDEYKSVLDYLQENNIPVFWGNDVEYKNNIIKFMCS
jgi:hypothetical protein